MCGLYDGLKIQTVLTVGIENRKRSDSPMMDNSVSSDGFAGSVPVVTNPPPPLATEAVPRPSPRQRLLAALAGLLPRNLPASNPLSGGATPPSSLYKRASRALGVTAFLAALAVGLLFLLPGGLVSGAGPRDHRVSRERHRSGSDVHGGGPGVSGCHYLVVGGWRRR